MKATKITLSTGLAMERIAIFDGGFAINLVGGGPEQLTSMSATHWHRLTPNGFEQVRELTPEELAARSTLFASLR